MKYVFNIRFEAAVWSVQLKSPPPFTTSFVILPSTNSHMQKHGITAVQKVRVRDKTALKCAIFHLGRNCEVKTMS